MNLSDLHRKIQMEAARERAEDPRAERAYVQARGIADLHDLEAGRALPCSASIATCPWGYGGPRSRTFVQGA